MQRRLSMTPPQWRWPGRAKTTRARSEVRTGTALACAALCAPAPPSRMLTSLACTAFGHRLRKNAAGERPTAEPEINEIDGLRDGSVIVIVSDGVLNAYATPEAAVRAMAQQLWDIRKARRNPVKREDPVPLLQAAKEDHAALKILREAEKAANERKPHDHRWDLGCVFQRSQR